MRLRTVPHAAPMSNQPALHPRVKSQRIALLMLIALLGVLTSLFSLIEFRQHNKSEKNTLTNQARLIAVNLELHMRSANQVLEEIQALHGYTTLEQQRERMQLLVNAMPIIRGIGLLDSTGAQIAGTRMISTGTNFSDRPYFRNVQRDPQRHRLYISEPFRGLTGQVTIALSKAILNEKNEFDGTVFAVLEPDYIEILMSSTLYTPDMWAALAHLESKEVLWTGANLFTGSEAGLDPAAQLQNLMPPIVESRRRPVVWDDRDTKQIIATSTIGTYAGNAERPLLVVMGRSHDAAMSGWQRLAYLQAGLFLLFAAAAYGGLWFYQYRRRQYDIARAADLRLIESREHDYRLIVERTADCVVRLDSHGRISYTNPAFRALFTPLQPETPDTEFLDVVLETDRPLAQEAVKRVLEHTSEQRLQARCVTRDGVHHMEWTLCSIPGDGGSVAGVIGVGRDVTAHITLNTELRTRAERDSLTGLVNRGRFREIGIDAIEQAKHQQQPLSLMMIDLDHFKMVNDTWGHHAGDIALRECARNLQKHCREDDIAARIGGEEFTVLMRGGHEEAARVAERIRHAIESQPIVIEDGRQFDLTASIGVAVWQADEDLDHLMRRADAALYIAKQSGRNRIELARKA